MTKTLLSATCDPATGVSIGDVEVTDAGRLDAVVGAAQEVFHGEWSRDPSLRVTADRAVRGPEVSEYTAHDQRESLRVARGLVRSTHGAAT